MEELLAERRTIKDALNQLQMDAWVFEEDPRMGGLAAAEVESTNFGARQK
jgi:hypothetical protein